MSSSSGKRAILTGATSAVGEHVADALAAAGFRVTIAARVVDHARATVGRITGRHPAAEIQILPCDLASLASVDRFAAQAGAEPGGWDVLLHCATATLAPARMLTDDGFEWNFGVNYLGPFALTGLLLASASPSARVITTTSPTATSGGIKFYDLRWDNGYRPGRAYNASRLATMIQTAEFARRIDAAESGHRAILTHPGFIQERPRLGRGAALAERIIGHSAEAGAKVAEYAAAADVPNGSYLAPSGPGQLRGAPGLHPLPTEARDEELGSRLWRVSEQLTGVTWPTDRL